MNPSLDPQNLQIGTEIRITDLVVESSSIDHRDDYSTVNNEATVSSDNKHPLQEKKSFADILTFQPKFTGKFEFGVGITAENIFLGGGTLNYASVNLIGFDDNMFFLAGENKSSKQGIREVNEKYSTNFAGFGLTRKNVYRESRGGELLNSTIDINLFGFVQITQIDDYENDRIIQQAGLATSISFGLILMPELGGRLILATDTIPQ